MSLEKIDPRLEYTRRLADRRADEARLERRHAGLSYTRLGLFAVLLVLLWLVFVTPVVPAWSLAVPVVLFVPLAFHHETVLRRKRRAGRSAAFYEYGLARVDDDWAGKGSDGLRFLDPGHPYAADLDLFGRGSVFELVSQARTRGGEARLASWLLAPAPAAELQARQAAIDELRDRLDLRERLAMLGEEMEVGVHPEELIEWSRAPLRLPSSAVRTFAALVAVASVLSVVGWIAWGWGATPFLATTFLHLILRLRLKSALAGVGHDVDQAAADLGLLSHVLRILEAERFKSPLLRSIRDRLDAGGRPPSVWIRRLGRLVDALEARRNSLFAPVAFVTLWDMHFAFAIESWRGRVGGAIADWLDAVAEFEALSSLAGIAYERPDDPFAELVDSGPVFDASGLGHPLLPASECVRNDVRLDSSLRLLVVSGSNMSGKSTFLRTVGVSVVLALSGAPVRAGRLRLSPLALGASIRVQDSIQSGVSRFYAEILRLRQIVSLTSSGPTLLYLIDEVLQGTNSHDRRIGVAAVLRDLVDRGALGLITTHDLALTQIVDELGEMAGNVHFQDDLVDGRMVFDYKLRPGVVARSNALGLMRAIGLEV